MIHRTKNPIPPNELLDTKWNAVKEDVLLLKENHKEEVKCYRGATIEPLMKLYNNKCAICERDRGTELQVDHYRPKKPRDNRTNIKYNQSGYYWLTYEWTNLIPLCSKCNQRKSNKFPLIGWSDKNRIDNHINDKKITGFNPYCINWLQQYEKPLMINPEYEAVPEKHFSFKRCGKIVGRTDEGNETINICDLNRKDLRRERQKVMSGYIKELKSAFDDYARNRDVAEFRGELNGTFKRMKLNCHVDSPYSLLNVYIYKYFNYFIDSKLPINIRGFATKYFEEFKNRGNK